MPNNKFAKDALVMDRSTTITDILEYLRRRTKNPVIRRNGDRRTLIWNLSSHKLNESALEKAIDNLHRNEYVIPYSVGPVWASMMPMLPRRIQEAEVLRYSPQESQYIPHHNYLRDMSEGEIVDFREEIGHKIAVD